MDDKFEVFIKILTSSSKKHGPDKLLTIGHLANIAMLASSIYNKEDVAYEKFMDEKMNEIITDRCLDRE